MLYALERIGQILDEPQILSTRVRAHAEPNNLEGIGGRVRRAALCCTTTGLTRTA